MIPSDYLSTLRFGIIVHSQITNIFGFKFGSNLLYTISISVHFHIILRNDEQGEILPVHYNAWLCHISHIM